MKRFNKTDWLDFALQVLAKHGPDSLSIERLCKRAKRTKGSFYHHFSDHQTFLDELLAHWQQLNLHAPIEGSSDGNVPERLASLNRLASVIDPQVEVGLRRLAARNPQVQKAVTRVDQARLDYLVQLYSEGGMTAADALNAAKLQYSGFVGAQILWPATFEKESVELGELLDELLRRTSVG